MVMHIVIKAINFDDDMLPLFFSFLCVNIFLFLISCLLFFNDWHGVCYVTSSQLHTSMERRRWYNNQ